MNEKKHFKQTVTYIREERNTIKNKMKKNYNHKNSLNLFVSQNTITIYKP